MSKLTENLPEAVAEGDQQSPRRNVSLASVLLLLFAVASAAGGQVMLKHGMATAVKRAEETKGSLVMTAAFSPWVLFGLTVFAVSAVAWLATLSKVPLSLAYPFNALGYLGILTASVLVLHEKTNIWTWVGTSTVVLGLIIVVSTKPS